MNLGFPVIDLHTHLRNNISEHTKIAKEAGIDIVVYMANCEPPLDNVDRIKQSLREKRYCQAIPVSAITKDLAGKELVDVAGIKPYVVGFSDDGKYLKDLGLLKEILAMEVLVLAHCSSTYEKGLVGSMLETKFIERYLPILEKTKGKLHIQHISKKESVELIRNAKRSGLNLTCETCPHYFIYTEDDLAVKVNPPLATKQDIIAIKKGLADGTIDVIASDYAPPPRKTGIAGFRSFIPLAYSMVLEGTLSIKQLKEKLFINPKKIIKNGNDKLNFDRIF
ncbi:amidohydrolase family protein [Patescibacteria group bacterium]|nr:amidohydrolase family protein [Patescibacteria group bacterium]